MLRQYQRNLEERRQASSARSTCIQLPTGAGKSHLIQAAAVTGGRVLALAHAEWLIDQLHTLLGGQTLMAGGQHDGSWPIVGMIQTVARRELPAPDTILIDECFPAGTMIDGRPIEDVRLGQSVRTFHPDTGHLNIRGVVRIFKGKTTSVYRLTLDNGRCVVCTPGHPILTFDGWQRANQITQGCGVFIDPLFRMRADDRLPGQGALLPLEENRPGLLFNSVQPERALQAKRDPDGQDQSSVRLGSDAEPEPDAEPGKPRKDGGNSETYWSRAEPTPGEWPRGDRVRTDDAHSPGAGMGARISNSDREAPPAWTGDELQGGFSPTEHEASDRDRWRQPWWSDASTVGSEESGRLGIARVVGVEVHEQGGSPEFERLCPGGDVYNFEVEDTHTYFANGLAVHNCHHTPSPTYREILARYPDAQVVGFTATPQRLDGLGLDDIFEELLCGPSYQTLIAEGWLKPFEVMSIPSGVDLTGVETRAGEFAAEGVKQALRRSTIFGDVVEHYLTHCRPLGGHASFWPSIEMATEAAERFRARGVRCLPLHSKLPRAAILAAIAGLRDGTVESLATVGMIGEGLDVPGLSSVSLCRPTKSLTVYLQQSGRCNRGGAGVARVMDHVANWQRHGLPDDDREWTLAGRVKRRAAPGAIPIWTCPQCWMCVRSIVLVCPGCGEPKPREIRALEQRAAALELITRAPLEDVHDVCATPADYREFARRHSKQPTWAAYRWWERDNRPGADDPWAQAAGRLRPTVPEYLAAARVCGVDPMQARVYARLIGLLRGDRAA